MQRTPRSASKKSAVKTASTSRSRRPVPTWLARSTLVAFGVASGLGLGPILDNPTYSTPSPTPRAPVPTSAQSSMTAVDHAMAKRSDGLTKQGILAQWLEMAEAERLKSLVKKVTGAGLDKVAEGVISRLEEGSLKSLIASTTDFSSAELAEIDDIPGFAMDLARIAMEGTVREASEPDEEVRPIDFSTEITWDHRASFSQSQFSADADRIYAVFESDDLGLEQTLAKWTRVKDGEILLFKRHTIRTAADSSFVYLNAPPGGWSPGAYRVDFYSADRELRWLASGEHRITR
jgi:hypothetical protein